MLRDVLPALRRRHDHRRDRARRLAFARARRAFGRIGVGRADDEGHAAAEMRAERRDQRAAFGGAHRLHLARHAGEDNTIHPGLDREIGEPQEGRDIRRAIRREGGRQHGEHAVDPRHRRWFPIP